MIKIKAYNIKTLKCKLINHENPNLESLHNLINQLNSYHMAGILQK